MLLQPPQRALWEKTNIFHFQVSCSQLHDGILLLQQRGSPLGIPLGDDHTSTKFWLQCDLQDPLGREIFWKHILVMAMNMPGFLSFIQNQREGGATKPQFVFSVLFYHVSGCPHADLSPPQSHIVMNSYNKKKIPSLQPEISTQNPPL